MADKIKIGDKVISRPSEVSDAQWATIKKTVAESARASVKVAGEMLDRDLEGVADLLNPTRNDPVRVTGQEKDDAIGRDKRLKEPVPGDLMGRQLEEVARRGKFEDVGRSPPAAEAPGSARAAVKVAGEMLDRDLEGVADLVNPTRNDPVRVTGQEKDALLGRSRTVMEGVPTDSLPKEVFPLGPAAGGEGQLAPMDGNPGHMGSPGTYTKTDEMLGQVGAVTDTVGAVGKALGNPIGAINGAITDGVKWLNSEAPRTPAPNIAASVLPPAAPEAPPSGGSGAGAPQFGGGPRNMLVGFKDSSAAAVEAAKAEADALVDITTHQAQATEQFVVQKLRQKEAMERQSVAVLASEEKRQERMGIYQKKVDDARGKLANLDTTIDPTRYWKNKDAGQIALGAIAGALFGFAGKGLQYLDTIQQEINTDIDAQKATYQNASEQLKAELAASGDEYARAREEGLSMQEAEALAWTNRLGAMDKHLEGLESQGLAQKQLDQVALIRGELGTKIAERQQKGYDAATKYGFDAQAAETARYSAATARASAIASQTAKAAKGPAAAPSALIKQVQGYDEMIGALAGLEKLASRSTGKKLATKLVSTIPGADTGIPIASDIDYPVFGSQSEAVAAEGERVALTETYITGLSHASITKTDAMRLKNAVLNPSTFGAAAAKQMKAALTKARADRAALVAKIKGAGFRTEGLDKEVTAFDTAAAETTAPVGSYQAEGDE